MAIHADHDFDDPILPRVPLKLGKVTLYLCFTYAALAIAESEFRKLGQKINILHALDFEALDATSMVALLYAALITHQPETKIEQVPAFFNVFRNIGKIREALVTAFIASLADPAEVPSDESPLAGE